MNIDKHAAFKMVAGWSLFAWLVSHLLGFIFPAAFESLDNQGLDRIQRLLLTLPVTRPDYDDLIVHVDLNNSSLKDIGRQHPDRADHARVIRNLAEMGVAVQMLDFIYAGATTAEDDEALANAVRTAAAVTTGMALRMKSVGAGTSAPGRRVASLAPPTAIQSTAAEGLNGYAGCAELIFPFDGVASSGAVLGYLTLAPDRDGVFRRLPLIVRCGDGIYPSFTLAAVVQYLGATLDQLVVAPGGIIIKNAQFPGAPHRRDFKIPVDPAGRLRIHYVGPWGGMVHYRFADIYLASRDQDALEILTEELAGKIVLLSDVTTGATELGRTPVDFHFPLSGVHANAVHTILAETFLEDAPGYLALLIDAVLIAALVFFARCRSSLAFTLLMALVGVLYLVVFAGAYNVAGVILPLAQPLTMVFVGLFTLLMASSVANARMLAQTETARQLAEQDLAIGRSIQTSFLPSRQPCPPGWQVATHFEPARQVSGDFYDLFDLGRGRYLAIVIADVCDKGVGAALFMALIRSLVRAFAIQDFNRQCDRRDNPAGCSDTAILNTIDQTNRYIADTHADANMFATLFMGILEHETGRLRYVNCGHEPPLVIGQGRSVQRLIPTGPALGAFPDSTFTIGEVAVDHGETILAFTDGLIESESSAGEAFGKKRLAGLVTNPNQGARSLLDRIVQVMALHTSGQEPFDDVTIVALRREAQAAQAWPDDQHAGAGVRQ